eukprot:TRINITY_DN84824_c0_g1_i1.p1 TRINITY_DN84824_c0_g1~~TRINITY_DN84824_c0_g1_i1.p1  ORF type:complete len:345 (-),score=56.43 TRINITY_DN84824_c0_g1_i1:236-1207(-)
MDISHPSPYSEQRYLEISAEIQRFAAKVGYKIEQVNCIPIVAYNGENLVTNDSPNMPWYKGKGLLDTIDSLTVPTRHVDLPFRMSISDCWKITGVGTVVAGTISQGVAAVGDVLHLEPTNINAEIRSIETFHVPSQIASAGDMVAFNLKGVTAQQVHRGFVLSATPAGTKGGAVTKTTTSRTPLDPTASLGAAGPTLHCCQSFQAQMINIAHPRIRPGFTPFLLVHTEHIPAAITKLEQIIDKQTGNVLEENPREIPKGARFVAEITPKKPLIVAPFKDTPAFGRFVLRDNKNTVCIGVIKSVTFVGEGGATQAKKQNFFKKK